MIDRNKKYKINHGETSIHVGHLLKTYFTVNKCNRAALAKQLGINRNGLTEYVKRESVQVGILWKLSLALQHNFIADVAQQLPIPVTTANETNLLAQLDEKNKTIEKLEIELAVYKRINGK
ncbi:hypothetical protein [Flavobacterium sp.]|uniref:hypothetical protein n=1 Tax=Flavobacterium sp. TaxID=239 RepID=UPI002FDB1947